MYKNKEAEDICHEILSATITFNDPVFYPTHVGDTGYYHDKKSGHWVGWDNTTGDMWVEDFRSSQQAKKWCEGKEVEPLS